MIRAQSKGFGGCPVRSQTRYRRYFVEFNYRKGEVEIYMGKIDLTVESTRNSIADHKAIAQWVTMTLLGGMNEYALTPEALNLTVEEHRKILTAEDINELIRCGQKPSRTAPNQAFVFDGAKCLWRVDVDESNGGIEAELTDVAGRNRKVYLLREFSRPSQPQI